MFEAVKILMRIEARLQQDMWTDFNHNLSASKAHLDVRTLKLKVLNGKIWS